MSEELKPCPFCGGKPESHYVGDADGGYHAIECRRCNGSADKPFVGVHGDNHDHCAAIWNTRPAPAVQVPVGLDDGSLRAAWRLAGGSFHGPNIETGTMPEAKLLPFLRSLAAALSRPAPAVAGEQSDAGAIRVAQIKRQLADAHKELNRLRSEKSAGQVAYEKYVDDFGIHGNRFPSWRELNAFDRIEWEKSTAAAPTPAPVATEAVAQGARDAAFIDVVTYGQGFLQIGADGTETHIPAESVVHEPVAQGGGVDAVLRRVEKIICDCNMSDGKQTGGYLSLGDLKKIRALLATPAVPVGDGWMPIETAPKDGTLYLAWGGDTYCIENRPDGYWPGLWSRDGEQWRGAAHAGFRAAHWQPLPPAPAATKKEA